jgi:hypothetical protein
MTPKRDDQIDGIRQGMNARKHLKLSRRKDQQLAKASERVTEQRNKRMNGNQVRRQAHPLLPAFQWSDKSSDTELVVVGGALITISA